MGSKRPHRVMVAWLVALALLSNLLAGALVLSPASAKAGKLVDAVLGTLVICNGAGDATDHGDGAPRPSSEHCKLCPLLSSFALLATLTLVLLSFPVLPAFRPPAALVRTLADHLSLGGIHSRGPPLRAA
jgi:hypothetical protein